MQKLTTTVESSVYTIGDILCTLVNKKPVIGEVQDFDAYTRAFTLKSPDGMLYQLHESDIEFTLESAPIGDSASAHEPTPTGQQVAARTINAHLYPGSNFNQNHYDTTYNVNVYAGGNFNVYGRAAAFVAPSPPTFTKCLDEDKFYQWWLLFYQNTPYYSGHTGLPTNVTISGPVTITRG